MGTRGYRAWRHKGRYVVYYNHWDSYPSGLGVEVWGSIPQDPRRLEKWVEAKRAWLDGVILEFGDRDEDEDGDVMLMREPPCNDLYIEWIYTIDLDNLVFHIDSKPVFSLTNLPKTENEFLEYIGGNSYGHRSYTSETPLEYQFCGSWSASPPAVDENVLGEYTSLPVKQSAADDVLEFPESSVTGLRRKYVEIFVGALMRSEAFYKSYLSFLQVSKREDLPTEVLELAKKLICVVLAPPMFSTEGKLPVDPFMLLKTSGLHLPRNEKELLWWMRDNLCVYISSHLDDPKNLQASVVAIVKEMQTHDAADASRPKFGVIFSITKCAVVRLDNATNKIVHTSALDFLPSWHATSPHTEGITLLARLCEYFDDLADGCPSIKPPLDDCEPKLPVELVSQVLKCVLEPEAIFNAARASSILKAIAKPILMQPYFNGQFLVGDGDDTGARKYAHLAEAPFLRWDGQTQRFPTGSRYSADALYIQVDFCIIDALRGA
ncbi:hypothetical protein CPB85DRAFT_1461739 [Mucidula mucida]|nr:hypothetical protein CPB85DRAFT_1461739 [Mucidula mucida]